MNIKESVIKKLMTTLELKIQALSSAIESAKESRNNDTKSSAGDKFETGREMIQAEINKNSILLATTQKQLDELSKIDANKPQNLVDFGSLVSTNNGNYFISVALGKITIENQYYFALSLASPIGQLLKDKTVGDIVHFNNRKIEILNVE